MFKSLFSLVVVVALCGFVGGCGADNSTEVLPVSENADAYRAEEAKNAETEEGLEGGV